MRTFWLLSCLIALAPIAGCGAPQGWSNHRNPAGFTVSHPAGWKVDVPGERIFRIASADGRAFAIVQALMLPREATAAQLVQYSPQTMSGTLPGLRVERAAQGRRQPDEMLASMTYTSGSGAGRAAMLLSLTGRVGMLYLIAAPAESYELQRPVLISVLRSFRFEAPQAPSQAKPADTSGLKWVTWRDPLEGAFTIEVPAGWKVQGGQVRLAPTRTKTVLDLVSGDGSIRILNGDPEIPKFQLPNASMGTYEGSQLGTGPNGTVCLSYRTGAQFLREYVPRKIGAFCSDVSITETRDSPELDQAANARAPGLPVRFRYGSAEFTCQSGGQPMRGQYMAATSFTNLGIGGSYWDVATLMGFVARPEKFETAAAVCRHMIETLRTNTNWASGQMGVNRAAAAAAHGAFEESQARIASVFGNSEAVRSRAAGEYSKATLGVTDVVDPRTGETFRVASGHNYYWRSQSGAIAGTRMADAPDIDFTPLQEY